ncbi:MAG: hypothetical protein WDN44_00915 [Sphingomonas sp.]
MRTSDGAPMHWLIEDPAIHALNRRLAAASGTRVEQGEPLLILRYRPGQQYRPHLRRASGRRQPALSHRVGLSQHRLRGRRRPRSSRRASRSRARRAMRSSSAHTLPGGPHRSDGPSMPGCRWTRGTKYLASRWIRERRHAPDVSTA